MKGDKLYLIHLSESITKIELYIAGLRNILVHDYLGIELETVWIVLADKLPELKDVVHSSLE